MGKNKSKIKKNILKDIPFITGNKMFSSLKIQIPSKIIKKKRYKRNNSFSKESKSYFVGAPSENISLKGYKRDKSSATINYTRNKPKTHNNSPLPLNKLCFSVQHKNKKYNEKNISGYLDDKIKPIIKEDIKDNIKDLDEHITK